MSLRLSIWNWNPNRREATREQTQSLSKVKLIWLSARQASKKRTMRQILNPHKELNNIGVISMVVTQTRSNQTRNGRRASDRSSNSVAAAAEILPSFSPMRRLTTSRMRHARCRPHSTSRLLTTTVRSWQMNSWLGKTWARSSPNSLGPL